MRLNFAPSACEPASEARISAAFSRLAVIRLLSRRSVEVKSVPTRVAALKSLPDRMISFLSHSVQSTPDAGEAEQLAAEAAADGRRHESTAAATAARPALRRGNIGSADTIWLSPSFQAACDGNLSSRRVSVISSY